MNAFQRYPSVLVSNCHTKIISKNGISEPRSHDASTKYAITPNNIQLMNNTCSHSPRKCSKTINF